MEGRSMSGRFRPLVLGVMIFTVITVILNVPRFIEVNGEAGDTLEATADRKWYRGNLHTHSLWSDGDDYLEMIALWYRDHGYDFLAFTDHNVVADKEKWVAVDQTRGGREAFEKLKERFPNDWIEVRAKDDHEQVRLKRFDEVYARLNEKGKFLLIQGEEISDGFGRSPIHLNATNVVKPIRPHGGASVTETIQNNVNAVIAQRERTRQPMMVHLNHPNFGWGITAEDLAPVRGESFFEVYNGHPEVNNAGDVTHASTERLWDIVNTKRVTEFGLPLLYGLATDDGHSYHKIPSRASEPGRGWVMVLAEELTPRSLIRAMESGRFYASSGVRLEKLTATSRTLEISVFPEPETTYTIEFIGTREGYDAKSEPVLDKSGTEIHATRIYSNDIGKVFKTLSGSSASYEFSGDELFVRARITSSRLHPNPSTLGEFQRAWTQPVRPGG
jgi:hypothetical protein